MTANSKLVLFPQAAINLQLLNAVTKKTLSISTVWLELCISFVLCKCSWTSYPLLSFSKEKNPFLFVKEPETCMISGCTPQQNVCWDSHHAPSSLDSNCFRLSIYWIPKQTFRVLRFLSHSCSNGISSNSDGLLPFKCVQLWNSSSRVCSYNESTIESARRLYD